MKAEKIRIYKELRRSLAFLSFLTTNLSVLVFAFLEYNISVRFGGHMEFNLWDAAGMIIPFGAAMGLISWVSIRKSYSYVSPLLYGLERVAGGDFKGKLDIDRGGPFKEIYVNFNKMTRELENTQTLREDFINHFSHEFKTPIMSINGFATLLLKQDCTREEEIKYLELISEESKRLADLSKNSLLLTKLETTEIPSNREPYLLDEQIRECVILLSPLWGKKSIDLSAELLPLTISADRELMKHVWINLISNAIKYTPPGGTIFISLEKINGKAAFSVKDTGVGIGEEDLPKIFNKFHKGRNMYKSPGLGLGLSIVKGIVDLSGGTIEVESAPGEGSRFTVELPLARD